MLRVERLALSVFFVLFAVFVVRNCDSADKAMLRSMPSEQELAMSVAELRSLYADEYRKADDRDSNRARNYQTFLCRELMNVANHTSIENSTYVPLMMESIRLATAAKDATLAFSAIAKLQETHSIDSAAMQLEVLKSVSSRDSPLGSVTNSVELLLPAIQQSADFNKFEIASEMAKTGVVICNRILNVQLEGQLMNAVELLKLLQEQKSGFDKALELINRNPNDRAANLTASQFLALRQGAWERAEQYAVHADSEDFRSLIVRQFSAPQNTQERIQLADDWWEFSESQSGIAEHQSREIAVELYVSALPQLSGIEQKKVEAIIADAGEAQVIRLRITNEEIEVGEPESNPVDADAPESVTRELSPQDAQSLQKHWADYIQQPVEIENSIGIKFVVIPPGEFTMGSDLFADQRPPHRVRLTKLFRMASCEVTELQYEIVIGSRPAGKVGGPNYPVAGVSWRDAVEFCNRLSRLPEEVKRGRTYRLPTEAEWEFSCRASSTSNYHFGSGEDIDRYAWTKQNAMTKQPVGTKQPSRWGLYDMHGNVYEWCHDYYGAYWSDFAIDPEGPLSGALRVRRGGSFYAGADGCRSSSRHNHSEAAIDFTTGIRVVMDVTLP